MIPKIRKQVLEVKREAIIVKEKGEWVQAIELVYAEWVARHGPVAVDADGIALGNAHSEVQRLTVHAEK